MSDPNELIISGVKVRFPNKPYPSQFSMMSKIIRGLQKKENCLLESPTGSGKTLSLLCSVIAWQQSEKINRKKLIQEESDMRAQQIRDSCYCQCNKDLQESSFENGDNIIKTEVTETITTKRKKVEIKYEDGEGGESVQIIHSDSNILSDTDHGNKNDSDNSENNLSKHKKIKNECSCICHNPESLEDIQESEVKKIGKIPTVYFATRTHKQITNVIKEFKKTSYGKEARMTILASREHTCIHPVVSRNGGKNDACKKLTNPKQSSYDHSNGPGTVAGKCIYFQNFKKQPLSYENYGLRNAWDIEDLIKSFKKKNLCPFYGSRELKDMVDVVFCPYNYLIDPRIRSSMKIDLNNQIVIVDEAHNVEDSCRESATSLITKIELDTGIVELEKLKNLREVINNSDMWEPIEFFLKLFKRLNSWIDDNTKTIEQRDFNTSMSRIFTGVEMRNEFSTKIGIGPEQIAEYQEHMNNLFGDLGAKNENEDPLKDPIEIPDGIRHLAEHLFLAIDLLYMQNNKYVEDFKVAIVRTKLEDIPQSSEVDSQPKIQFGNRIQNHNHWTYTIHFWCLNPAVAFHYLKECHSIILCSGTLSPMDTFQSELGVKFEHTLEANHVISDKQVWVGCLGSGPTGENLLSTYKFTEKFAYQDEIGRLVLDVCKTIPYGVLIFLPSYALLNKLVNRWSETQMDEEIKKYKEIFSETRVAKGFDQMLKEFYDCIDFSRGGEFHNGALMLAVYRGRASEGLDFSDNYARAVIAVGIPFPSIKDTCVDLKRKYNNALCKQKGLLNGDEWYEIQAYRAINQGLGRCIRHRKDWGAIILVDERYFKNPQRYMKGISKWIRSKFKTFTSYNTALTSLKDFNENMKNYDRDAHLLSIDQSQSIKSELDSSSQKENNTQNNYKQGQEEAFIKGKNLNEIKLEKFQYNMVKEKFEYNPQYKRGMDSSFTDLNSPRQVLNVKSEQNSTPSYTPRTSTQTGYIKDKVQTPKNFNQYLSPISMSIKRKSENMSRETNVHESQDLAAKKSFFKSIPSAKKKIKSGIEYIDESQHEVISILSDDDEIPKKEIKTEIKTEIKEENTTVIDSSIEERFEDFMNDKDSSKNGEEDLMIKKEPILQISNSPPSLDVLKLNCIHCNEFISDFSPPTEAKDEKHNKSFFTKKYYTHLPSNLKEHIEDNLNLQKLSVLTSDIDRISFESNTKVKSFTFFLTNNLTTNNLKLTQNSFLDESTKHCWQYFECKPCMKIIGFSLKNSDSGNSEQKLVKNYLNKIILIKNFEKISQKF